MVLLKSGDGKEIKRGLKYQSSGISKNLSETLHTSYQTKKSKKGLHFIKTKN